MAISDMRIFRQAGVWAIALIAGVLLAGCAGENQSSGGAGTEENGQASLGETLNQMAGNFREGPELPSGWPAEHIPLPDATSPVASLGQTTIPGDLPVSAVFFSTTLSGGELRSFFESELPGRGWVISEATTEGDYSTVVAEGHGYSMVIGAGVLPRTMRLESGADIGLQIGLVAQESSP